MKFPPRIEITLVSREIRDFVSPRIIASIDQVKVAEAYKIGGSDIRMPHGSPSSPDLDLSLMRPQANSLPKHRNRIIGVGLRAVIAK